MTDKPQSSQLTEEEPRRRGTEIPVRRFSARDIRTTDSTTRAAHAPNSALEPIKWRALKGWAADDHAAAFATFLKSCRALIRTSPRNGEKRPMYVALMRVCSRALAAGQLTGDQARLFFEHSFRPLRITKLGDNARLLTGYYEPIVDVRVSRPEFLRSQSTAAA